MSQIDEIMARAKYNTGRCISALVHDAGAFRIYGTSDRSLWAVVDKEDFDFFSQWPWGYGASRHGKIYVARTCGNPWRKVDGFTVKFPNKQRKLYLHREIANRPGFMVPPSPDHKIVGHLNGNSLDCRRANLAWQTYSQNNTNQHGRALPRAATFQAAA